MQIDLAKLLIGFENMGFENRFEINHSKGTQMQNSSLVQELLTQTECEMNEKREIEFSAFFRYNYVMWRVHIRKCWNLWNDPQNTTSTTHRYLIIQYEWQKGNSVEMFEPHLF